MKRFLLSLIVVFAMTPTLANAAIAELIGDPSKDGDPDPVETILVKDTGDAFSADEFNTIIDILRGFSHDNNNTAADQTDDKIGINGIATPDYALDVNGDIQADFFRGDGSLLTGIESGYWNKSGADELNYPDGNVGIGIADPDELLHILGADALLRIDNSTSNAGTVGIRLSHVNGTDSQRKVAILSEATGSWGRGDLHLAVDIAGDAGDAGVADAKLTIDGATGDVGIGTTTPVSDTHIYDGSGSSILTLEGANTGATDQQFLSLLTDGDGATAIGAAGTKGWVLYGRGTNYSAAGESDDFGMAHYDGTSWTTPFVVDSATDNVGIGTAVPAAPLQVESAVTAAGAELSLINTNYDAWTGFYQLNAGSYNPTAGTGYGLVFSNDGDHTLADGGFSIVPWSSVAGGGIRILEDGNVGIGKQTPTYDLDVTGDINFTGDLYQNGVAFSSGGGKFVDGTPTATEAVYTAGNVGIGTVDPAVALQVDGGSDAALTDGSGYLVIGDEAGGNIVVDSNEIIARNNGAGATLYLQGSSSNAGTDIGGHLAIGANGDVGVDKVIDLDEHFDTTTASTNNTYQIYSNTTATSLPLVADRTTYGSYYGIINNKTESGSFDSDAQGLRGYVRTTGTSTFRNNYGVTGEGRNESTAASGLGNLYGVMGTALQNAASGQAISYAYGVYGNARGKTNNTAGAITNARGVYGTAYAYGSDVTNATGVYGYAATNNGYDGDITTAYGVYGRVQNDSDDGGNIATAYGGYFHTAKRSTAGDITTAYGVYSNPDDADTAYGGAFFANDNSAVSNYGIYVEAQNASTTNIGIYGSKGDWILADVSGQVGLRDTTPDGTLVLDVEGDVGATRYCDQNGATCYTTAQLYAGSGGNDNLGAGGTTTGTLYSNSGGFGYIGVDSTNYARWDTGGTTYYNKDGTWRMFMTSGGFYPYTNNTMGLGSSGNRWYSVTAGIGDFSGNMTASNFYTTGRNVFFGTGNQRIYGDNSSAFYVDSGHSTVSQIILRDNEDDVYGRVYGSSGDNIGFLDGDGHWAYRHQKDTQHIWLLNNATKMTLNGSQLLVYGATTGNEGGEISLRPAASGAAVQLDNYAGNMRVHTLASGKYFDVLGGEGARAEAFYYSSDERLKENIVPIGIGKREKVLGLGTYAFDWKDGHKDGDLGLIAQEVEESFPEFVNVDPDGYKVVDYPKLVVPLLEVAKDQESRIEILEARLEALEQK